MTFKIVVADPKTLLNLVSTVAVLADEATLCFTPDAITVKVLDPSRVAMINVAYPKTLFTEYCVSEPSKVGLNLLDLAKLLRRADKNDKTTLETVADGKLQLTFQGPWQRKFTVPTLEASTEEPPAPNITFNVKASLVTHALTQSIEDAQFVSDHMFINADTDTLRFTASGDLMNADITMQKGNDGLLTLETKTPAKSCYSLSYLIEIVKAGAQISDIVNLEYTTDMPVKLDFVVQEGKIEFYLAPRIQDQ